MSSVVAKMLFTVVTVAITGLAAYFLTAQRNEPITHFEPRRRRRSSTPPMPRNNGWYDPPDEDDDIEIIDCIESSPSKPTEDPRNRSSINACSICLGNYEDLKKKRRGFEIHSTLCGHIFCELCIRKATRIHPFCPQCRKPCPPGSTHAIYI